MMGLLRVDSGTGVDTGKLVAGDGSGEVEGQMHLGGVLSNADGEDGLDSSVPGAAKDLIAFGGVCVVEVEMRV
jgi:hypothetical protein